LGKRPDAIIFNGDLAGKGESDQYPKLRGGVEPLAAAECSTGLGDGQPRQPGRIAQVRTRRSAVDAPLDRVRMIDGLRIITVDTSVSGFSHGDISTSQLD
jgi:hypothetical protein